MFRLFKIVSHLGGERKFMYLKFLVVLINKSKITLDLNQARHIV